MVLCLTVGILTGKGLIFLNALRLVRNLFWEVTSAIQEQYSHAVIVPHFLKTGLHKQPLMFTVENKIFS